MSETVTGRARSRDSGACYPRARAATAAARPGPVPAINEILIVPPIGRCSRCSCCAPGSSSSSACCCFQGTAAESAAAAHLLVSPRCRLPVAVRHPQARHRRNRCGGVQPPAGRSVGRVARAERWSDASSTPPLCAAHPPRQQPQYQLSYQRFFRDPPVLSRPQGRHCDLRLGPAGRRTPWDAAGALLGRVGNRLRDNCN